MLWTEQATVVLSDTVSAANADEVTQYDKIRLAGRTVTTVEEVVNHPYNRKVTIVADLRVRETTSGLTFKGESLQQGSTVVIDLGTITVEATVVGVGG